ncbi:bifunctional 23S rRNA (guanine(2069)-N(7))-methyltransferase RlmK/23S rRNA (guanine(2445)-N(2))-methyltransferase RlmL [Anaerobiospirillum sp. NML120448]|uniref:bifunctional 23S rRNA (guanine(2069)-N(7))-methyltransferase RlmK/23S rRNA (guanine(2445)-N(2))-methyltransferase RlmL n=1 Tax=Anaerobiospirillum sp. NML120448 TaxID=2932816 RepID=UPI0032B248BD
MQNFFATCPKGLENLLFRELVDLNASSVKETVSGVSFSGNMELAMRVCLYSRFASRIIMNLNTFRCDDDTDLYLGAKGIGYERYFDSDKTIAVSFNGTNRNIRNTQYGALRVKDAVCDRFVECKLERPDVQKNNPDIHIIATLKKGELAVGIDLSGSAQFWREYHRTTGAAPLKENLAAAMVVRSGFNGSQNFIDPMCGSGTLLLEAALLATDTAPGLARSSYGFMNLKDYDENKWQEIYNEALERSNQGKRKAQELGVKIFGFDADSAVVQRARDNIEHAGFSELVSVEHCLLDNLTNPCQGVNELPCVVVTNPPYGERMGNFNELILLYTTLGHKLKTLFKGGRAAVISTSQELLSCLRLSLDKSYRLFNGALECQLRVFNLDHESGDQAPQADANQVLVAVDFSNRLTKNLKNLEKWANREKISAYRIYDADLPDYNAAIDRYNQYYIIQEYQAPSSIKAHVAQKRLLDMIAATIKVTGAIGDDVIVKSREKQKGESQYAKRDDALGHYIEIYEQDVVFKVNLQDYLDTGLFLDARPIRRLIRSMSAGKDFLNLFAYTCSASVMAALGGAKSTTSVDMSRTYLDWGKDNFKINGFDLDGYNATGNHHFTQDDCLSYLSRDHGKTYDLIYIDPPTFSNSKRMEKSFDVQRDHLLMLGNLTRHLNDGGVVIFCTNKRNFKLDDGVAQYGFTVENITPKTFDPDFKRDQQLHTCFKLVYNQTQKQKEPEALVTNTMRAKWSKDLEVKQERFSYAAQMQEQRADRADTRSKAQRSFDKDTNRRRYDDRGGRAYSSDEYENGYGQERSYSAGRVYGGVKNEANNHEEKQSQGNYSRNWGYSSTRSGQYREADESALQRQKRNVSRQGSSMRKFDRKEERKVRVWGANGVKDL